MERAFGVLKRRFYCLGNILRTDLKNTLPIIICCCVLHNVAIECRDEIDDEDGNDEEQDDDEDEIGHDMGDREGDLYREDFVERYFTD